MWINRHTRFFTSFFLLRAMSHLARAQKQAARASWQREHRISAENYTHKEEFGAGGERGKKTWPEERYFYV